MRMMKMKLMTSLKKLNDGGFDTDDKKKKKEGEDDDDNDDNASENVKEQEE